MIRLGMRNNRRLLAAICAIILSTALHALPQNTKILCKDPNAYTKDSIQQNKDSTFKSNYSSYYKFKVKQLILPASMASGTQMLVSQYGKNHGVPMS